MTAYPLTPLARIRQLREDAAATECAGREKALLAARQETLLHRKALEDYLLWRKEEEERRYQAILGQEMPRREMEIFKSGIAALRDKDAILLEAVEAAQKAEAEAARLRDEAVKILQQRRKDKEKIEAHREIWQSGEAKEAERREDLEMEEFTGVKKADPGEGSDE
ncbi:MAG: type III secretion protein [Deltaproteobacteria bacterium]|jgi:type III secretion protein O|nr:type III secretion protein [Deltaproteobacteria bacterium]